MRSDLGHQFSPIGLLAVGRQTFPDGVMEGLLVIWEELIGAEIAALFRYAKLKNRIYVKCLTNNTSPLAIENGHGQQLPVEDG